jgi:aminopeptidase N
LGLFDISDDQEWALKRRRAVELDVDGPRTLIAQLVGEPVSDLVLVNDGDLTYARVSLDARSIEMVRKSQMRLDDDLARALLWGDLWDMVRNAELRAADYVDTSLLCIDVESDPAVFQPLISRIFAAFDRYADPSHRASLRESLSRAAVDRLSRIIPGSDLQLHWTLTFIDAARKPADVAWVAGLLDGTTKLEGLTVDFAVRWAAVNALATIGAAGPEVIADELERDPTDIGRREAAAASAARPVREAKEQAWEAVTADDRLSLATKRAIAAGFHRPDQEPLLEAYVQPYFGTLLPFWESHEIDEALMFVRSMYPMTIITPEIVQLVDQYLQRDLPGPMRRALLESEDGTKRALRARARDAQAAGSA